MSKIFWLVFVNQLSIICIVSTYIQTSSAVKRTDTILKEHGYPVVVDTVTTKDNYKLTVFHILQNLAGMLPTKNYPVLIQHCLFGTSADWVLAGPERSLPMQLVDEGYDVWLADSRGTPFSRGHVDLSDKEEAYWDFTIHHLGVFDLPAIIDHIIKKTGKTQIHHIGNSMSTSTFYIMASEMSETYQSKIRSHISIGPVSKLSNTKSSFKNFAPFGKALNNLFQKTSNGMFLGEDSFLRRIIKLVCRNIFLQTVICLEQIIFPSFGYDPKHFDQDLVPKIFENFPVSTSSKLFLHMSQFLTTDSFSQFDYGPEENKTHYNGSKDPPPYDLKKITVPITLFYATNDVMTCPEDVDRLRSQLPNLANIIRIEDEYFNHIDFLWSKNVTEVVNKPIMAILDETDNPKWKNKKVPNIDVKTLNTAKDTYNFEHDMMKKIDDFFSTADPRN